MEFEKFEKDMAAFTLAQHQDTLNYLDHLEVKGWTVEDAKKWIEEKKKTLHLPQGEETQGFICPLCGKEMHLLSVNITKSTQTEDGSKSVWLCPKKDCMHTIYNKESIAELSMKGGT